MRLGLRRWAAPALVAAGFTLLPGGPAAADDIKVSVRGGKLTITGDADANFVELDGTGKPAGTLEVSNNGTINGGPSPQDFAGITGALTVKLGAGNDALILEQCTGQGGLSFDGGSDATTLTIEDCALDGNVSLKFGDGFGDVLLEATHVMGNLKLGDSGGDTGLRLDDGSAVDGNLQMKNRDGADSFTVEGVSWIGGNVKIQNGDGASFLSVREGSGIEGNLSAKSGDGSDDVSLESGYIRGNTRIDLGDDSGSLQVQGAFTLGDGGTLKDGDLSYKGRNGSDFVTLSGPEVTGKVKLDLGGGPSNDVTIDAAALLHEDVSIKSKSQAFSLFMNSNPSVGGDIVVKSGASDPTFVTVDGFVGSVRVDAKGPVDLSGNAVLVQGDVRTKAGGDTGNSIFFTGSFIDGDLSHSGRDGPDFVTFSDSSGNNTVTGRMSLKLGGGSNDVSLRATTVEDGLLVQSKNDDESVFLGDSSDVAGVQAKLGKGQTFFTLDNTTISGRTILNAGEGLDVSGNGSCSLEDDLAIKTGNGSFVFFLGGTCHAMEDVKAKSGDGQDIFTLGITAKIDGGIDADFGRGGVSVSLNTTNPFTLGGDLELRSKDAGSDLCDFFAEDIDVLGDTTLRCGSGPAFIALRNAGFQRLTIDTGGGIDGVYLDTGAGVPMTVDGPAKVLLGSGDDTLQVGSFDANAKVEFGASVLFDGGSGDDLISEDNGNDYPTGEPTIKGFEAINP